MRISELELASGRQALRSKRTVVAKILKREGVYAAGRKGRIALSA